MTTRAGTSRAARAARRRRARRMARSVTSMRASGQPGGSAAWMTGSSLRWSRTTPPTISRKKATSASRYCSPSSSLPEPVRLELGEHVGQRRAAEIHLVERLHGGEARGAALVGGPRRARRSALPPALIATPKRSRSGDHGKRRLGRRRRPCSSRSTRARAQACASFSTVRMPLPTAERAASTAMSISAARGLVRDDVVMRGLAADDAAERDVAVVALRRARSRRAPWRAPPESRARPARTMRRRSRRRARGGRRAAQQLVGEVVVEARLDDEEVRQAPVGHRLASLSRGRARQSCSAADPAV